MLTGSARIEGVRGAIAVDRDEAALIQSATVEMLNQLLSRNEIEVRQVVSAIFTLTCDLTTGDPAAVARDNGWEKVSMVCAQEIAVPGSLPLCIRVLLHVVMRDPGARLSGVYLGKAVQLRPDIASPGN